MRDTGSTLAPDHTGSDQPEFLDAPAIPDNPVIRESFTLCHDVTRKRARNFYYGLKLTPEPRRSAGYAIYAYMRACDDLVDACTDHPTADSVSRGMKIVDTFRANTDRALANEIGDFRGLPADEQFWPAVQFVAKAYRIDPKLLHDMLDGQRCDLIKNRYDHFNELYDYCYRVASVVGLVCIRLWGAHDDPVISKLAEYRGIAFQLTNILRDLVEDVGRDRVYLPADELAKFGYSLDDLKAGRANEAFDKLMAFQIERARDYYEKSAGLEKAIHADCRATSWALCRIYRQLLEKIAENPRAVLTSRVRLSSFKKIGIAIQATWGDPLRER